MTNETTKYLLGEDRIPRTWYNIVPDMPVAPPPPLHPGTHQPIGPDDLAPLFPMSLIGQEVTTERYVEIPDPVREVYRLWRPTPLYRARRLEQSLDLPDGVRILYVQVRGHQPGRLPQAEHRRAAGLLQRRGGREADHYRDGRRPVGLLVGDGLRLLRH
jgi:tryptophan synthase beta chain